MNVVAAASSSLLILEFGLAALTWTPALDVAVARYSELAHVPPAPRTVTLIGLFDTIGVIGVVVGFWKPMAGVLAGSGFAALCGWILSRQISHGDRGSALVPYALFGSAAVALVVSRLMARS
ncbi:hypothetical protein [Streptomyces sp. NPDC001930]|uniref:hypothetical protein n=1 Tax=Streptomyces sp. NPDC001930 TaxID=3364625 RepID=UPI0036B97841